MSALINSTSMIAEDSEPVDDRIMHKNRFLEEKSVSSDDNSASDSPSEPLAALDGEGREGSESEESLRKRRRRRVKGGKHHRKWKPYNKLSWNERKKLDERETARANQKREEAFAHGHPVAPYNTTQFLMEDHIKNESISSNVREDGNTSVGKESSDSSSESMSSSEENEAAFMEKEFSETYNNIHAERLQMMSKDELIKDYLEMETKLERLQKRYESKLRKRKSNSNSMGSGNDSLDSFSSEEELFEFEAAKKMEKENELLKKENKELKFNLKMALNNN